MEDPRTFYTSERANWREWLIEHFEKETEIWFLFPMKESGDKSLSYNDAVEEALCFGWIDSTIKHVDPYHRAQRFSPRRKGSEYSRANIERLIWLEHQGLIHPKVRESVLEIIKRLMNFLRIFLKRSGVIKRSGKTIRNFQKPTKESGLPT